MHQDMPLALQQPHAHRAPLLYAGPFSRATAGINHCAPDRKAEYRGERVCVSLCARVFVRDHVFGTARPIFANFCACYLRPWLGPPLAA